MTESKPTGVQITEQDNRLILNFEYRKQTVETCKRIPGARFRPDKKWQMPAEAAVELVKIPSFLQGNEAVLEPLARQWAPIVERRACLQADIKRRGHGTASQLYHSHYPRYIARSRKQPGKVVARYGRDPKVDKYLLENAAAQWNSRTDSKVFLEWDLPFLARELKGLGFAFETALADGVAATMERIRRRPHLPALPPEVRRLRGAMDAELDYTGANGFSPFSYQRADILFALECLRQVGGWGGLLSMGLGKTIEVAVIYDLIREINYRQRALILCPLNAIGTWARELEGWLPARVFWAEKPSGENGRKALEKAVTSKTLADLPIVAVISGNPDARHFALECDPDIVVINYDTARTADTIQKLADWLQRGGATLAVADEMHRFQNPFSLTAYAVMDLITAPQVQRENGGGRIGLTGTAIAQGPWQAYVECAYLDGGIERCRWGASPTRFMQRYFFIDYGPNKNQFQPQKFKNSVLRAEYETKLAYATTRRTKEQHKKELGLPEKLYSMLTLELDGGLESRLYRSLAKLKAGEVEEMDEQDLKRVNEDLLFVRMKQVLSHPGNLLNSHRLAQEDAQRVAALQEEAQITGRLLDPEELHIRNQDLLALPTEWIQRIERFVEQGKRPRKTEILLDKLEDLFQDPDAKVVVGCDLEFTEQALLCALEPFGLVHFRSGIKAEERQNLEDRFQKDGRIRVALGKTVSMSEAMTLTKAQNLFLYDPYANGSTKNWEQFQDRIYRPGQRDTAYIHHLCYRETVDVFLLLKVIGRAIEAAKLQRDAVTSLPKSARAFVDGGTYRAPKGKAQTLSLLASLGGGIHPAAHS